MADREQFSFSPGELGITSTTEEVINAGESFLNSDPNDVKFIPKGSSRDEEEEDDEKEVKKDDKKAASTKKKEEKKDPDKQLKEDDFFSVLSDKADEEEEEEEVVVGEKDKKDKEKVKTTTQPGAEEEKAEDQEDENVFSTIAQELVNHGIFSLDEDEESISVSSPEELLERFQLESRKQASTVIEKFLNRFGDEYREMFENVFVRGINPVDYLSRYTKVEGVKDLDLTNEANQEKVVRELLRTEGRSSEYIEKRITQLKNYNDLLDEATEAKTILVDKQQKEVDDLAQKKQQEIARTQQIKAEYMNNVGKILTDKLKNKEFDGIPIDKKFAEETYGYLTQERYQTPDGQLLTSFDKDILDLKRPENHETKVKVAMLIQLLKTDPQLTKIAKKAVSKEGNQLFQGLKKTAMKQQGGKVEASKEAEPKSWF